MPGAEQGKISQPHYFKKVVEGVLHGPQALKYALVAILVVLGASHFIQSLDSLSLHHQYRNIYRKDLLQDYLLAKALLAGDNPYLPLPELARRFMEPLPHQIFPHPSPHPPPVALFLLPLGLLPYKAAAVVWFWAEIAFLLLTAWVLVRWASGQATVRRVAFGAALMFCFTPFFQEVALGQLMLPVLVCLTLAWHLLRSGKDFWGGIFLGVAISIKLFNWPFMVFLALQRNWRAVAGTLIVLVSAHAAVMWLAGSDTLWHYYGTVAQEMAAYYRGHEDNFSLWTIGWRIFAGTGAPALTGVMAPPLIQAPKLAPFVSLAICLTVFLLGLRLAAACRDFDASFAILICLSILVSPIAWSAYLILVCQPMLLAAKRLLELGWPKKETEAFLRAGVLLLIPSNLLHSFICLFSYRPAGKLVPFLPTLASLIPALALLMVLRLMARIGKIEAPGG